MPKTKIAYIRLDEQAEAAIAEKIDQTSVNQSDAIRMIIREWAEMRKQYVTVPIAGVVAEDGKMTIEEELARR